MNKLMINYILTSAIQFTLITSLLGSVYAINSYSTSKITHNPYTIRVHKRSYTEADEIDFAGPRVGEGRSSGYYLKTRSSGKFVVYNDGALTISNTLDSGYNINLQSTEPVEIGIIVSFGKDGLAVSDNDTVNVIETDPTDANMHFLHVVTAGNEHLLQFKDRCVGYKNNIFKIIECTDPDVLLLERPERFDSFENPYMHDLSHVA